MILPPPKCDHAPEADKLHVLCHPCYEAAVRQNILDSHDTKARLKFIDSLQGQVKKLRAELEAALSDNHDMMMSRLTTFLRCECGRFRERGLPCRGCGQ